MAQLPGRTQLGRPPQATLTPSGGTLDQRLAQLALAVSRKADAVSVPVYAAIDLIDASGVAWRVDVDTGGQLRTTQVVK